MSHCTLCRWVTIEAVVLLYLIGHCDVVLNDLAMQYMNSLTEQLNA